MSGPVFVEARRSFHANLIAGPLRTDLSQIPAIADRGNNISVALAKGIIQRLGGESVGARLDGQTSGKAFEDAVRSFIEDTFLRLGHIRPGDWRVILGSAISGYDQYAHLGHVQRATERDHVLAAALGTDYVIKPDVLVVRGHLADEVLNQNEILVDPSVAARSTLRTKGNDLPLLHASISCKWTLRSDRAQNARSEALNLLRNRKGRVPHVVTVTAEPLPSRLASLALGTGDIDCLYHFALPELISATEDLVRGSIRHSSFQDQLMVMVDGKRLKDIADLPLDLAV